MSDYEYQYERLISNIDNDMYECRVCLENINIKNAIKPCSCSEGIYHKECIIQWIQTKMDNKELEYDKCEICNTKFKGFKIVKKSTLKTHCISGIIITVLYVLITYYLIICGLKYYNQIIPIFILISYILLSILLIIIMHISIISVIDKTNYFCNNKSICPVAYQVININNVIN